MPFQRTGECNRCGQCCGAEGSPNQANPWPVNWLESHQQWNHDDFVSIWPYAQFLGITNAQGKPHLQDDHGQIRFTGGGPARVYFYTWVDGHPCKDTSIAHDGSSYSLECPLLADGPGDGSRPCGLVGEHWENFYQQVCYPEGPLEFATQAMVDQWQTDHPLCSHAWVEV